MGVGTDAVFSNLFEEKQSFIMSAALEDLELRNKTLEMDCSRLRVEAVSVITPLSVLSCFAKAAMLIFECSLLMRTWCLNELGHKLFTNNCDIFILYQRVRNLAVHHKVTQFVCRTGKPER